MILGRPRQHDRIRNGASAVELLVIVGIIAILAGIILSATQPLVRRPGAYSA